MSEVNLKTLPKLEGNKKYAKDANGRIWVATPNPSMDQGWSFDPYNDDAKSFVASQQDQATKQSASGKPLPRKPYDPKQDYSPNQEKTMISLEDMQKLDDRYQSLLERYTNMPSSGRKVRVGRRLANYKKKIEGNYNEQFENKFQELQREQAENTSAPMAAWMGLGRFADKMSTGTADLLYDAVGTIGQMPGLANTKISDIVSQKQRESRQEQADRDESFNYLKEAHPVSTFAGETAPYFTPLGVEGFVAGQTAKLLNYGKNATNAKRGFDTGFAATRINPADPKYRQLQTALSNEVGKLGETVSGIGNKFRNRNLHTNPYQSANFLPSIIGEGARAGLEGALHYDNSATEDAGLGMLGYTGMRKFGRMFERPHNFNTPTEQNVVDWSTQKGYNLGVGDITGNPNYQLRDHNMKNDTSTNEATAKVAAHNNVIDQDIVAETLGLNKAAFGVKPGDAFSLTGETLKKVDGHFSGSYNKLLEGMKMSFPASRGQELRKSVQNSLDNMPDSLAESNAKLLNKIMDDVNSMVVASRDQVTGAFRPKMMTGQDYQDFNKRMAKEVAAARRSDDLRLVDALEDMKRIFDEGVDESVRKGYSAESADALKALNERYAMYNMALRNSNAAGIIDKKQLFQEFNSSDKKRMLMTEASDTNRTPISNFHMMARLGALQDRGKPGLLSRKIDTDNKMPFMQRWLTNVAEGGGVPFNKENSWLSRVASDNYLLTGNNRPKRLLHNRYTHGLLNLPGPGQDFTKAGSRLLEVPLHRFGDIGNYGSIFAREVGTGSLFDTIEAELPMHNTEKDENEIKKLLHDTGRFTLPKEEREALDKEKKWRQILGIE